MAGLWIVYDISFERHSHIVHVLKNYLLLRDRIMACSHCADFMYEYRRRRRRRHDRNHHIPLYLPEATGSIWLFAHLTV
jgi:hypothetical protein